MGQVQITKENWKKFTRSALIPNAKRAETHEERVLLEKNTRLLEECEQMYNSLQDFRDRRNECIKYFFGDQLSRLIPNPEGCGQITIERYAINQGMTPLKMNLITSRIRAMVGSYEKQKLEDLVLSRDKDEEKLGEMMSVAMQYVYQNGNLYRANADGYREFLISALPIFRTGYGFDNERKFSDVYTDLEDSDYMFWDDNTSGRYFKNITTIGKLHEMSRLEILSTFAKTPSLRRAISDAFAEIPLYNTEQQFSRDKSNNTISFSQPRNPSKFRVIEVWRREEHEVIECQDPLSDSPCYVVDLSQEADINIENERRINEIISFGGSPEDAAIIEKKYRVDTEWTVRFLLPNGYVLYQALSPYEHGSHPWAIGGYPMVKGRVQSLLSDLMQPQDMVNRLVMRMEFIRMNQAKGFGIIDLDVLNDSDMDETEFAKKYTSAKGIAALRLKGRQVNEVFQRFTDEGGTNNDMAMLNTYINMIDQMSGSTSASRGEQGGSHESASRYMMETENSNNNTCDGEQWFNGLVMVRDYKLMSLVQQYYKSTRYINIAGNEYAEESKYYNPEKIKQTLFDLAIIQQPSSGIVRMTMKDTLNNLLQAGAIDGDTYLELDPDFGSEKVLRVRQRNQEKQMQMQQAAMEQQAAAQQAQPVQQQQQ